MYGPHDEMWAHISAHKALGNIKPYPNHNTLHSRNNWAVACRESSLLFTQLYISPYVWRALLTQLPIDRYLNWFQFRYYKKKKLQWISFAICLCAFASLSGIGIARVKDKHVCNFMRYCSAPPRDSAFHTQPGRAWWWLFPQSIANDVWAPHQPQSWETELEGKLNLHVPIISEVSHLLYGPKAIWTSSQDFFLIAYLLSFS